ncbi:protein of unknown function [Bradyrhizobium vignae]|uniref:Uncharacterized protein n=1 Tax=Bradyrhizobium vignae TaxID=1549949 RepID=A0A2U3Q8V4_9BRAD|nr:protein of unknown function [Bradyrhizobium vignae]
MAPRTWGPLIKRHIATVDFSREFLQLTQNPVITDQGLATKSPTGRPQLVARLKTREALRLWFR